MTAPEVGTYTFTIYQGNDPFTKTWIGTDTDTAELLTGVTLAEARIKPSAESATTLLDLTKYLTVDETQASISLSIPKAVTGALTFTKPAVWDLFITQNGVRKKKVMGYVRLDPNVTP